MLDTKINRVAFILVLFIMAVMLSGCYTLVGPPPESSEMLQRRHTDREYIDRDYDYYDDIPYDVGYWDEYNLYYSDSWYPYYYGRYWYKPWWWYDSWDYWHDDGYYVPENKPDTKNRGASDFGRSPQTDQWRDETANKQDKSNDEDNKQEKKDTESRRSPKRQRNVE